MLALTRRVTFCAGHVYKGGGLSAAELSAFFGPAALPGGHGHNYILELTVEGPVSGRDGMVVNIKDVDAALKELLAPIDHRMLNDAMDEFRNAVPTTERLAQALFARLPKKIGAAVPTALRLEEQPGLYVELEGKDPAMVYLTRSIEFAAAHRLHAPALSDEENRRIYGKCNNPNGHGHNYVAEITVRGEPDAKSGIVVDLGRLEQLLAEEVEERFDHKHLNKDLPHFKDLVPTAENIAKVLWEVLAAKIPSCRDGGKAELHRVRLIETARSWFDYYGK